MNKVIARVLAAHRRYTSGNGDALAGALTYALLVGSAPAVLLCSAALGQLDGGHTLAGASLLRDAHVLLPSQVVRTVDGPSPSAGHWWSPVVSITAVWLLFTAIMLRASWPRPGRPAPAAAMRAALVAALACALLAWAAHAYLTRTSALHAEIYQAAGTLIGVLVWCSLTCRVLLRATAWASTAPVR